jgi:integrase
LHLSNRRERYRSEAVRALRHAFGKAWDRPADALDRAAVVRSLDAIAKAGHGAIAARTAAYGRACFSWHAKRGAVTSNPFATLPAFGPRVSRERVLSDLELAAVWHAAEAIPGSFGRIVQLLILTGARRSEVAGMLWSELDADLETWSIGRDRMKAGAVHVVPLSPQARTLLSEIDRGDGLVLPGDRPGRPVGGWSKGKAALDRATSVEGWTLHDLRRTVATGLQRLGVRLEVTEAVLGHTSGSRAGIVGVYQRHDWQTEKRGALDAWGRHVEAIVNGEGATENVVKLAAR